MKKLLFLLCTLPLVATAQKWDIGIYAGGSINSIPQHAYYRVEPHKLPIGYSFALRGSKILKDNWKIGIDLDVVQIKNKHTTLLRFSNKNVYEDVTVYYATPAFIGNILINKGFIIRKHEPYIGLVFGAGYFYNLWQKTEFNETGQLRTKYAYDGKGMIINAGVQFGYSYHVSKNIAISFDVSPRYTNIRPKAKWQSNVNVWHFPAMAGVRYIL